MFEQYGFIRIHKSYVVNKNHVISIIPEFKVCKRQIVKYNTHKKFFKTRNFFMYLIYNFQGVHLTKVIMCLEFVHIQIYIW
ncbi:LytTR family transcriptional regulator DNA-binding domain-containing protein [Mycoplasmatota bacterium]|nr:LytTR family transcriptional regulator DNA-binding domain-containing protein [Mycoplasmatota bacterium]